MTSCRPYCPGQPSGAEPSRVERPVEPGSGSPAERASRPVATRTTSLSNYFWFSVPDGVECVPPRPTMLRPRLHAAPARRGRRRRRGGVSIYLSAVSKSNESDTIWTERE